MAEWIRIGNLEWLNNRSEKLMNWHEAKEWCQQMGGRLPTRVELLDLCDNHPEECRELLINDFYISFWSLTEFSVTAAWSVILSNGCTGNNAKATNSNYVRCVR